MKRSMIYIPVVILLFCITNFMLSCNNKDQSDTSDIGENIEAREDINVSAQDWPQWRGINRDGHSAATQLLRTWPVDGPTLLWKISGIGIGYSSSAAANDRLYVTGDKDGGGYLMALSAADGKMLWSTRIGKAGSPDPDEWQYPGQRCTPTVNDNLAFAVDPWGQFVCVDAADGKEQWRKHFVDDFGGAPPQWGYAESPLVDGDQVVFTPGGSKGSMVALNKQTGELIWQSKEFTDDAQYSSIVLAEIDGVRQYIQLTMQHVVGISPKDGSVLWKTPREGRVAVIPTPVVDGNYVYVISGYNVGSHLFHITSSNGRFSTEQVYAIQDMANHHGGVVKVGDYLYGYSDSEGLACQNFMTGEIVWAEREKIKKGSVSYADGMLYFREERSGDMVLVEAVPTGYSEISRFAQPDRAEEMAWPHPVIAHGKLYIRDQENLFCYDVRKAVDM